MSTKFPISSEERKRLLRSFVDLPPNDKEIFYKAAGHLRWLTVLWDLEKLDPSSMPDLSEKRHILLAYKVLQILWFEELPKQDSQTFTIFVCDRLPEDQTPETITKAFDSSTTELADLCKDMPRPDWLKNVPAVKTSIELFPEQSR